MSPYIVVFILIMITAAAAWWLRAQFGDIARRVLKETLDLANDKLETDRRAGLAELNQKKDAIDASVKGLNDHLETYRKLISEFEADRNKKYGALEGELKRTLTETDKLQRTTANLTAILGNVKVRGQWGQKMAEDILRLTGLQEGTHYVREKETAAGRPDYTFLLPDQHKLFMDVKFPLNSYLKLTQAETEDQQKYYREEFTKDVRAHLREMEKRGYANSPEQSLDFILLFIPNEQVYGLVNEWIPGLLDECLHKRMILCGPWTFYAIVRVIYQAWDNYHYTISIKDIVKTIDGFLEDYDLFKKRFQDMGDQLGKLDEKYRDIMTKSFVRLDKKIQHIKRQKQGQPPIELDASLGENQLIEALDQEEKTI